MPKVTTSATTIATVEVTLEHRVQQMLLARCEEHAALQREIETRKARQERLKKEVEDLFAKAGQSDALDAGTEIEGHKVKMVRGKSKKLDKLALLRALDITAEELDAFFDERPNKPYIRISPPGSKGGDDE